MFWRSCGYPKSLLFPIRREYTIRFYEDLMGYTNSKRNSHVNLKERRIYTIRCYEDLTV